MKKLLLLGGSEAQLVAIKKTRELGYYSVLCDFLPDNPGQEFCDKFYLVSTTDKDAVLEVAKKEQVDGIVAYGSDPAAPTAAYVAQKLGLPGVPYETARSFCEKDLFREFLSNNGFNIPRNVASDTVEEALSLASGLDYPLIVKPTDSSGSKGVTVVRDKEQLTKALELAADKSRCGNIVVEEFIDRDHPHVVEAEIFVCDGKVSSWGLMNTVRDARTNPLLPAAYTYPLDLPAERVKIVRDETSRLIEASGVKNGAFNIEMVIDARNRLFFLDAGPRNGGNMLSEYIGMIGGKDLVSATLKSAMGEHDFDVSLNGTDGGYWGLGVLHSETEGKFAGIEYSDEAAEALLSEHLDIALGDPVKPFDICSDLVGLSFFKFKDKETQVRVMERQFESMRVKVQ